MIAIRGTLLFFDQLIVTQGCSELQEHLLIFTLIPLSTLMQLSFSTGCQEMLLSTFKNLMKVGMLQSHSNGVSTLAKNQYGSTLMP
jgi:hypothetical protein